MVRRALGLHGDLLLNLLVAGVQVPRARRQPVDLVLDDLAAIAGGGALDHSRVVLIFRRIAAQHIPARPFLPDHVLGERVGAHRVIGDDVKHVLPALFLSELGRAGADVHDDRVLGLGQIGDGEKIVGLEVGDDERASLGKDALGRLDDVVL